MSGAERRRRKRQRESAMQAVWDLEHFLLAKEAEILHLHHLARGHAGRLRKSAGQPMPHSAWVQQKARGLDADLASIERLLRAVFLDRTAAPERLGLGSTEVGSLKSGARRALAALRLLAGSSIEAEISDSAASALARAVDPALHSLVWCGFHKESLP